MKIVPRFFWIVINLHALITIRKIEDEVSAL